MIRATFVLTLTVTAALAAQQQQLQPNLRDRDTGVRTSEFQTYVGRHQLLFLTSAAYTRDHNLEYNPLDWGYGNQTDLRGTFRSRLTAASRSAAASSAILTSNDFP